MSTSATFSRLGERENMHLEAPDIAIQIESYSSMRSGGEEICSQSLLGELPRHQRAETSSENEFHQYKWE